MASGAVASVQKKKNNPFNYVYVTAEVLDQEAIIEWCIFLLEIFWKDALSNHLVPSVYKDKYR